MMKDATVFMGHLLMLHSCRYLNGNIALVPPLKVLVILYGTTGEILLIVIDKINVLDALEFEYAFFVTLALASCDIGIWFSVLPSVFPSTIYVDPSI